MPRARKIPSGRWRAQLYIGSMIVDGKRKQITKSFVADTKHEAEYLALAYQKAHGRVAVADMTLNDAIDKYIGMRDKTLSPSTVRGYRAIQNGVLREISDTRLKDLDTEVFQRWVNSHAYDRSAKTLRNAVSFAVSAVRTVDGSFNVTVTFPTRIRKRSHIPTRAEIDALCDATTNENTRKAILLAAFCSLRRSEACALTLDDIDFDRATITVSKSMVESPDGFVLKPYPKTEESNRTVPAPQPVLDAMRSGPITCTPNAITRSFDKTVKRAGLPHIRYHDLRHFFASYLHAKGIPDAYVEKFGGWKQGSDVMKRIYREAIEDEEKRNAEKVIEIFVST